MTRTCHWFSYSQLFRVSRNERVYGPSVRSLHQDVLSCHPFTPKALDAGADQSDGEGDDAELGGYVPLIRRRTAFDDQELPKTKKPAKTSAFTSR